MRDISREIGDFWNQRSPTAYYGSTPSYITRIVWIIPTIFVPITSSPTPRTFTLPESLPDAYAEWGGPSDFNGERQTLDELEASVKTETVRVSNPEDSSQFVDVQRYLRVSFVNADNGNKTKLRFVA